MLRDLIGHRRQTNHPCTIRKICTSPRPFVCSRNTKLSGCVGSWRLSRSPPLFRWPQLSGMQILTSHISRRAASTGPCCPEVFDPLTVSGFVVKDCALFLIDGRTFEFRDRGVERSTEVKLELRLEGLDCM